MSLLDLCSVCPRRDTSMKNYDEVFVATENWKLTKKIWEKNEIGVAASGASSASFLNTCFFRGNGNKFIGQDKFNFIAFDFKGVWF